MQPKLRMLLDHTVLKIREQPFWNVGCAFNNVQISKYVASYRRLNVMVEALRKADRSSGGNDDIVSENMKLIVSSQIH